MDPEKGIEEMLDELRKHYWDIQVYNAHEDMANWMLRVKHKNDGEYKEYKGLFLRPLVWKALEKAKEYK